MNRQFRLGVDIDGVLADFNRGYRRKLEEVSGKALLPDDEEPPCWFWPEAVGYTKDEDDRAWDRIKSTPDFWFQLHPMPEVTLEPVLPTLFQMLQHGHEVYFPTSRVGNNCWLQTYGWLQKYGMLLPTMMICRDKQAKGLIAKSLDLTHFVDDMPENCYAVADHAPTTQVYMIRRRYNSQPATIQTCYEKHITIIANMREFFTAVTNPETKIALA